MAEPRFVPSIDDLLAQRRDRFLTVIAGPNNSGKSLVLKLAKEKLGIDAYMMGAARFYHVVHLGTSLRDPMEKTNLENQFRSQLREINYNIEQNMLDLGRVLLYLNNQRRNDLLALCGDLLGCTLKLRKVQHDNDLSPSYVDMDGQNVSVGSSGTRLLLTMLGMCMDEHYTTILIDEPELGLAPRLHDDVLVG